MDDLDRPKPALSDALNAPPEAQAVGVAAATPEPATAEEPPDRHDAAIDAWVAAYIHNSPIARSTEAFNHMTQVALPALRLALQETI